LSFAEVTVAKTVSYNHQLKYIIVVNSVVWPHTTDTRQPGPDNICGHTNELTATMYFNWWFWLLYS